MITPFPLIRTIYLYLFALVGLTLMTIGSVRFVDMGLKAFVFIRAEEEQRLFNREPPYPGVRAPIERIEKLQNSEELSDGEKVALQQWLADYKNWQEHRSKIDLVVAKRHRDASLNSAFLLIGIPLYLFHWGIIRREMRQKQTDLRRSPSA
ncbi:MAG: Uncharacterized protein G01um101466_362 [Parcubacteria group bacterium Gr01-1014_66]|nr:MAG: Uncharacterized protein G01um101466_362 [Parcubacteria group bacterium Gr01-1014_66]